MRYNNMRLTILFLFIFSSNIKAQDCDAIPALNQEIVELAEKKIKRKVGTGECWDLAKYVLDEVDAEWDDLYEYGKLINPKKDCLYPGDIIQFKGVKLKWEEGGVKYQESMKHHTAIVYEVISKNEIILIHQNTGHHGRKVGTSSFLFDAMTKGELKIYRPVSGS